MTFRYMPFVGKGTCDDRLHVLLDPFLTDTLTEQEDELYSDL